MDESKPSPLADNQAQVSDAAQIGSARRFAGARLGVARARGGRAGGPGARGRCLVVLPWLADVAAVASEFRGNGDAVEDGER